MPCPPRNCANKLGRMSSYSPSSRSSLSCTSDSRAQSCASRSVLAPSSPFLNVNHITLTCLFRASSIIGGTSESHSPRSVLAPASPCLNLNHIMLTYLFRASSIIGGTSESHAHRSVLALPSPFLNLNHITLTYLFRASSIIARTSNSQARRSVLVPSSLPFSTLPTPPPRSLPGRPQEFLVWLPRFAGHLGVTFTSKYRGALLHPRSKLIGSL